MYRKRLLTAALLTFVFACENNQSSDSSGKAAVTASSRAPLSHFTPLSLESQKLCEETGLMYCRFAASSSSESNFLVSTLILRDLANSYATDVMIKSLKSETEISDAIEKIARRMQVDVSKLADLQAHAIGLVKNSSSQFAYAEAEGEFQYSVQYLTMSFRDEKGVSQVLTIHVGNGE